MSEGESNILYSMKAFNLTFMKLS